MYCNHFGFSEKPFDVTPDHRFLYLNSDHRETLASLTYGIQERRGFITIVGEVGTGKTTLLNAALAQLDDKTKSALIFNTNLTFEEMLITALVELGVARPKENLSELEAISRLNDFAIQQLAKGGNVALIVDEAQILSNRAMENIRLLSNLETRRHKLIQIVLSGQPELGTKLGQHELRQLAQRISIKRYITPLNEKETYEYIQHRLAIAGYKGPSLFDHQAQKIIWEYSGGIPRKINILCDNSFLIGYALKNEKINAAVLEEAIRDLDWSPFAVTIKPKVVLPLWEPNPQIKKRSSGLRYASGAGLALAACFIFVLGLLLGNSRVSLREDKFLSTNNAVHNKSRSQTNSSDQSPAKVMPKIYAQSEKIVKVMTQNNRQAGFVKKGRSTQELEEESKEVKGSLSGYEYKDPVAPGKEYIQKRVEKSKKPQHLKKDTKNTKPQVTQAVKEKKQTPISTHPYSLRLSCLRRKENAKIMLSSYKRSGLSPYIAKVNLGNGGVWWAIYMGSYKTREEANRAKKKYKLTDSIITKTPYANLIGVFSSESEMADNFHQLEKKNYSAYFLREIKAPYDYLQVPL